MHIYVWPIVLPTGRGPVPRWTSLNSQLDIIMRAHDGGRVDYEFYLRSYSIASLKNSRNWKAKIKRTAHRGKNRRNVKHTPQKNPKNA